ncbi:MAG: rRNA maturation RNase YbeY [Elusimicrobia bacterium]|nr:rRNA maturation RNase YbeY [Elusimicrobiota bacterium]
MSIKVFDRQNKIKLDIRKISDSLPQIIKKLQLSGNAVYNIIFLDDKNIRELNKKYHKTDYPTDVLSFKYSQKTADVFISVETAKSNSIFYKERFSTEIMRLIIHGILHSLDFTDYSEKTKKRMWKKQENILKCLR